MGQRFTMKAARKITVEVPAELLKKAQDASGRGITQTVRTGLELICSVTDLCPAP
jgi:hypothetical protein